MTQIILSQRKESGIKWLETCPQTYMHKTHWWADEVHSSSWQNPLRFWALAERFQRAWSRNTFKIPHCLTCPHRSFLSLSWRWNIFPHLKSDNWFYVLSAVLKSYVPPVTVRGLALVWFSSHTIQHLWFASPSTFSSLSPLFGFFSPILFCSSLPSFWGQF